MITRRLVLCLALAGMLLTSSANAGFVITLQEIGTNLKVTGAGSFDLTGLLNLGSNLSNYEARLRFFEASGGSGTNYDMYSLGTQTSGPSQVFGGALNFLSASSTTGDIFGYALNPDWKIMTNAGYTSGDSISGTAIYYNANYASVGMTAGDTRVFTFANGQTITINAVPEPTAGLLVGAGLLGMVTLRRNRKDS